MSSWINYLIVAIISLVTVPLTAWITLMVNYKFKFRKIRYQEIFIYESWNLSRITSLQSHILNNLLPKQEKKDDFVNYNEMPKIKIEIDKFDLFRFNRIGNEKIKHIDQHWVILIRKTITNRFECIIVPKKEFNKKKILWKYGNY